MAEARACCHNMQVLLAAEGVTAGVYAVKHVRVGVVNHDNIAAVDIVDIIIIVVVVVARRQRGSPSNNCGPVS